MPIMHRACVSCPHSKDCLRIGECLDDTNARDVARQYSASYMTPSQALAAMGSLQNGVTLRRMTGGGRFGPPIVSLSKFKKHCERYYLWAIEANELAQKNRLAADYLKGAAKRMRTHCQRGHPLSGDNLGIQVSYGRSRHRYCKQCNRELVAIGGIVKPATISKVKKLLEKGVFLSHITGQRGGHYTVPSQSLTRYRRENPQFNQFVLQAIEGNTRRALMLRYQRARNAGVREQENDYHRIAALVPRTTPNRDDVIQSIFVAIIDGSLKREDVQQRIGLFVTEQNKVNPSKYGVSLDAPLYREGNTTLIETVSADLWGRDWQDDEDIDEYG
jgi:hypothetical protein